MNLTIDVSKINMADVKACKKTYFWYHFLKNLNHKSKECYQLDTFDMYIAMKENCAHISFHCS